MKLCLGQSESQTTKDFPPLLLPQESLTYERDRLHTTSESGLTHYTFNASNTENSTK